MSDSAGASTAVVPPGRRRRPAPLTVLGLVLLVIGLGCLGWVGYQYVGTNLIAERAFDDGRHELRARWQQVAPAPTPDGPSPTPDAAEPASVPAPGELTALLRIPALGAGYEVPVLEGADLDVLARGVGHYPDTAPPGQVGNFALAGHRVTHGEPFKRLLELRPGDEVVVETASAIYTYALDEAPQNLTVADTATWVLDPVPGRPELEPSRALLTLTTCQDLVRSPDRSVGFGHLRATRNK